MVVWVSRSLISYGPSCPKIRQTRTTDQLGDAPRDVLGGPPLRPVRRPGAPPEDPANPAQSSRAGCDSRTLLSRNEFVRLAGVLRLQALERSVFFVRIDAPLA